MVALKSLKEGWRMEILDLISTFSAKIQPPLEVLALVGGLVLGVWKAIKKIPLVVLPSGRAINT